MDMNKEVEAYYREYKRRIVLLLAVSGLWPEKHPKLLRIFLSALSSIVMIVIFVSICGFSYRYFTDIKMFVRGLGMLFSCLSSFTKVFILALRHRDIKTLNNNLMRQFEKDLEVPENRPHLLAHYPTFAKLFKIYYYYSGVALSMNVIKPVLALRHGKAITAHPMLLPFSYEPGSLIFWLLFFFEALVDFYVWCNTTGADSMFGMYALQMVGEMRLLSYRFSNLKSSDANYRRTLKECVDRNVILKESKLIIEGLFGFISVYFVITCAIIMCSIVFQITEKGTLTAHKILFLFLYSLVKLIQCSTFSWYGNIINVESERCIDSIYYADWAGSGDLRIMNDVLIIQSQRPMIIEVMGIMIVRLDLFTKMINTSVSYFFLLQTVEQNMEEST